MKLDQDSSVIDRLIITLSAILLALTVLRANAAGVGIAYSRDAVTNVGSGPGHVNVTAENCQRLVPGYHSRTVESKLRFDSSVSAATRLIAK